MKQKEYPLLNFCPLASFVLWVQVIVPALAAVFALTTWEVVGNQCPLLCTDLLDETHQSGVFIWRPHLLLVCAEAAIGHLRTVVLSIILFTGCYLRPVLVIHVWMINSHVLDTAAHGNGVSAALVAHGAWHHL